MRLLNSGKYNKIKRQTGVIVKKEVEGGKEGKKGKEKQSKVYSHSCVLLF